MPNQLRFAYFRLLGCLRLGRIACLLVGQMVAGAGLCGQTASEQPSRRITDFAEWWVAVGETNPGNAELNIVATVTFVDHQWQNLWLHGEKGGFYLPIKTPVPALQAGQRIRLTGTVPVNRSLSTEGLTFQLLEEQVEIRYLTVEKNLLDIDRFANLPVEVTGIVESQEHADKTHHRFRLVHESNSVECIVLTSTADVVPVLVGGIVTVRGVYAPNWTNGKPDGVLLSIPSFKCIQPTGWVATDDRVRLPLTAVAELPRVMQGQWVRVSGEVTNVSDESVHLRDATGTVGIATGQRVLPEVGTTADVFGRVLHTAGKPMIGEGIFPRTLRREAESSLAPSTLTRLSQWWDVSTSGYRQPLPLNVAVQVLYFDPHWRAMWVKEDNTGYYIGIGSRPLDLSVGDRVRFRGVVSPGTNISTDQVEVSILERGARAEPYDIKGQMRDHNRWRNLLVQFEGYVEVQEVLDNYHVRLLMIAEDIPIEVTILSRGSPVPDFTGSRVKVKGVYVPRTGPDESLQSVNLWVDKHDHLQIEGTLASHPQFQNPTVTIDRLGTMPDGTWAHVKGKVLNVESGSSFTLRDDHGQIHVRNAQRIHLNQLDAVDVIGRVSHSAGNLTLVDSLLQVADRSASGAEPAVEQLRFADQVIALGPAEAQRGLPVLLRGPVMWSHSSSRIIYLADTTRGARIRLAEGIAPPPVGTTVIVKGITEAGSFAPQVHATEVRISDLDYNTSLPPARASSLEQAMTGVDEGRWIELGGYIRSVAHEGIWTKLSLLSSGGEFQAWLAKDDKLTALKGAVVRIRGICAAIPNTRQQLTGIELWVPAARYVRVLAASPANPFSIALRPLSSLQQFNVLQSNNQPVRIAATVVHHEPGRVVFAEDGGEGIRILSSDTAKLRPGDRIEAVGLPGRENSRLVLREAIYRRIEQHGEPAAHPLESKQLLREDLDDRLAAVTATLIGAVQRGSELRLLLQSGEVAFDALLNDFPKESPWRVGSSLRLTGVYELNRDEYHEPLSFQLRLRKADDIQVVDEPSWWTARRALGAAGVLGLTLFGGLAWVRALRQRVRAQTREISCQLAKVAHLEARHRGIIENASDFIFTLDLKGQITSFNPAGEQLTGIKREQALSMNVRDLIAAEDVANGLPLLSLNDGHDGSAHFQCRFRKADGSLVWVDTRARLLVENGKATGILAVGRDFSERRKYEEALTRARDAAETNARAKSTFLANMSHEIRTPMNGVIGMSHLLLDTPLNGEQRDFAQTIRNSAEALLTVLNDILDFSKIEAGKLQFETLDFDLGETLDGTIDLLAARATAKRLELAVYLPDTVPSLLRGDPGRLRQVLLNLVGNAIKFTERGEVVVRVKVEEAADADVHLRFEVQDSGIGLSEEAQARLFQPFTQADGSTTRRFGGTGLGLAISKQIVELMGGTIGVTSAPGKGSTFWFTARFAHAAEGAVAGDPAVTFQGQRIAIVDDHETNRCLLRYYLSAWGVQSEVFPTSQEALAGMQMMAQKGVPYSLVIVDYDLAGGSGLQLGTQLQADPALQGTPILLMVSRDQRCNRDELHSNGVRQILTKPVRKSDLQKSICDALQVRETSAKIGDRDTPTIVALPAKAASEQSLRVLLAEDNIVNQRVAKLQLERSGHKVDVVANGHEALEAIERAYYDLILMDCQMPEMDGYEATRRIRAGLRQADIPIVAMTAHAMQGDREVCLEAGMNDYITKPVRMQDLGAAAERLRETINQRRSVRGTTAPFQMSGAPFEGGEGV